MRRGWASSGQALVVGAQGGSYVAFGLWSLVARRHYRRVHRLESNQWILNAHGMWLTAVGATLLWAAARDEVALPELRLLSLGTAAGLAANDAVCAATEGVAPIYRRDGAWEVSLIALGLLTSRRRTRAMLPRRLIRSRLR